VIVLCVRDESRTPALDRAPPTVPTQIGIRKPQTHDYGRFTARSRRSSRRVTTAEITGLGMPRHQHKEYLALHKEVQWQRSLTVHPLPDLFSERRIQRD
jgi:hypothetical protein